MHLGYLNQEEGRFDRRTMLRGGALGGAAIAAGTYGTCEVSGEQIEEDRLEADPAARTCKAHMNA